MPVREGPPQPAPPPKDERSGYAAEKARGADIILRTRAQRIVFFAGLIGAVLLAILLQVLTPAG